MFETNRSFCNTSNCCFQPLTLKVEMDLLRVIPKQMFEASASLGNPNSTRLKINTTHDTTPKNQSSFLYEAFKFVNRGHKYSQLLSFRSNLVQPYLADLKFYQVAIQNRKFPGPKALDRLRPKTNRDDLTTVQLIF